MTNQHRATPEQWAAQEQWASPPDSDPYALCLLELRARVESLQHLVSELQTMHNTATDWGMEQDARLRALEAAAISAPENPDTSSDRPSPSPAVGQVLNWQERIQGGALTLADALKKLRSGLPPCGGGEITAAQWESMRTPAPTDSLVERVAAALIITPHQARAAIREVAAWLADRYPSDEAPEASAVARILREQSEQ